jgi:hypothetical protein
LRINITVNHHKNYAASERFVEKLLRENENDEPLTSSGYALQQLPTSLFCKFIAEEASTDIPICYRRVTDNDTHNNYTSKYVRTRMTISMHYAEFHCSQTWNYLILIRSFKTDTQKYLVKFKLLDNLSGIDKT